MEYITNGGNADSEGDERKREEKNRNMDERGRLRLCNSK